MLKSMHNDRINNKSSVREHSVNIKHFSLVLLLLFSALTLHSQTDVFLINPGSMTLGQIFDLIEEQSDYTFFYNNDDVNADLELEIQIESAGRDNVGNSC